MKKQTKLVEHYNKFNEDKRLTRRHGQVEYQTTMRYLHRYLEQLKGEHSVDTIRVADIGAGAGGYAIPLSEEGYDVTAVELVPYNVGILKSKKSNVTVFQGSALKLKHLKDKSFDVTLLLGPMYHLFTLEEKVQALLEAKRVTKQGGLIFVAYLMNEYSVLVHGFRDDYIKECMEHGKVSENFHVQNAEEDLYDYVRIEDIDTYNQMAGLERIQIVASTGAANYMRPTLNAMDEETFQLFLEYHFATCERMDLMGATSHTLDILKLR